MKHILALLPGTIRSIKWHILLFSILLFHGGLVPLSAQVSLITQQEYIERSLSNITKKDTNYILLLDKSAGRLSVSNPDSALKLAREGLVLSGQLKYSFGRAVHRLRIAKVLERKGDMEEALKWYRINRKDCEASNRYTLMANYFSFGATLYALAGFQDTALQLAHKFLNLSDLYPQLNKDHLFLCLAYQLLGNFYMDKKQNPTLAIAYFKKAIRFAEDEGPKALLPALYLSLGGAWANSQQASDSLKKASRIGINYFLKAATIAQQKKDTSTLQFIYQDMSGVYTNLNQLDSAERYLKKILQVPPAYLSPRTLQKTVYILGLSFNKKKQYRKAIDYFERALDLALKHQNKSDVQNIQYNLYGNYKAAGQSAKALEHLEAYTFLRDSLLDEEKIKAMKELEIQYKTAEKDKNLVQQKLLLTQQQGQIKAKNTWIAIGALSTLLFASWLFLWRRHSQHKRKRQEEQIRMMQQEQQLWKQGEEIRQLNAMIRGEEQERARMGRELHDGILSQLSAAKMNFDALHIKYPIPEAKNEYRKAMQHLEETAIDLRKTAHNMMPGPLMEHGLIICLEAYCEKTAAFSGLEIRFVCEDYLPRMPIDFELSLYRMVQELVQNILKHAQASRALLQIVYHENLILLTVEDNGKGIDLAQSATSGIGLTNLKSRVKALKGRMEIKGRKNQGTSVYIEFDLPLIENDQDLCL